MVLLKDHDVFELQAIYLPAGEQTCDLLRLVHLGISLTVRDECAASGYWIPYIGCGAGSRIGIICAKCPISD